MEENKNTNSPGSTEPEQPKSYTAPPLDSGKIYSSDLSQPNGAKPSEAKNKFFRVPTPSHKFMKILYIVNIFTIGLPILFYLFLYILSRNGASGTEFIALLLLPVVPLAIGTVLVNLLYIPLYFIKSKPNKINSIIGIILILLSLYVVGSMIYSGIQRNSSSLSTSTPNTISKESKSKTTNKSTSEDSYQEIKKANALKLISDCEVSTLIAYNGDLDLVHENSQDGIKAAEESSTGIVFYKWKDDGTISIYASKERTLDLVKYARDVRDKCLRTQELRIYLDNTLERQTPSGTWESFEESL